MNNNKKNQPNIKIYVACHKESYVPENPYLYPIQVGTALSRNYLDGMLHDNDGDNISEKNKSYCELTAQYWAWKNDDADYYGFFHYRRYFAFNPELDRDDGWGNITYDRISESAVKEMKLQPEVMKRLILKYDVISVKGRRYSQIQEDGSAMDIYHEYGMANFQHRKDLDIALQVLEERHPEFKEAARTYMKADTAHECNMFIMKKEIYHAYCEWLFDILFETEKRIDTTWYSVEEYRVMGYLAERLCGIYYTYLKSKTEIRSYELPKTLFRDTTPRSILRPKFENGIPIVLSANDRFAPYLDVMIQSIMANANPTRQYDIIVLFNDISEKNRNLIIWGARNKDNISVRFIRVCEYFDTDKLFVDQHLSVETYYRLVIPEIMPDYHKILYLDCDMVVNHDVSELYDLDLSGCIIGAAKDIDVAGQVNLKKNDWDRYAVEDLNLACAFDYFQAGVLIIDLDQLRKTADAKKMIELAISRSWRCHDQDILNIICKGRVHYLPQKWNVLMDWQEPGRSRMQILKMAPRGLYEEYMEARKKPYMIHFAGYQKPWDVVDCDFAEYFWEYAKMSTYYPRLQQIMILKGINSNLAYIKFISEFSAFVNRLLPYGSKRRGIVKWLYRLSKK